jgi:rhodanese-related sulfurtransferase
MVDNVAPTQTWEALQADENAQLVDVRTDVEWNFVGLPDLNATGKKPILIQWQVYPTMQRNPGFEDDLRDAGMAAAEAARAAGFPNVFNVADGFEGPPDAAGHRGTTAGWKADSLPWRQR